MTLVTLDFEVVRLRLSATSERGKGIFSKITFLKSVHSSEKDELCPGFEVKIFTKSVHRGGVRVENYKTKIGPLFNTL